MLAEISKRHTSIIPPEKINNCTFAIKKRMDFWRVLLAILFPPLSVIDKGCGSILIVLILTLLGWIPGVIAALIILNRPPHAK